ncbi:MAG: DUF1667 domain-containing protein [Erysipelotrichaceae bacterium]
MKTNLTCIVCPMSCELTVENIKGEMKVVGNRCPRGENYAKQELINPQRTLTSTVKITGSIYPRLAVITSKPIPKDKMLEVMKLINGISVEAPIKVNDVIIENVCNLDVDILASRTMVKLNN